MNRETLTTVGLGVLAVAIATGAVFAWWAIWNVVAR